MKSIFEEPPSISVVVENEPKGMKAALLAYFRANSGRVLSRQALSLEVWGREYYPRSRTVDQTVSTLRKNLGRTERIVTIPGAGYRHENAETDGV